MISLIVIQDFLRKLRPTWSFVKIAFVAYLMYQLLKRHMQSVNPNYSVIKQTSRYKIWYDKQSNTYAIELDNKIIPYDKKEDIEKYL